MDPGLKDKVVLISGSYRGTGGHSKCLCQQGATVAVHGHEAGQADEVVEQIEPTRQATAVHGSLTSRRH